MPYPGAPHRGESFLLYRDCRAGWARYVHPSAQAPHAHPTAFELHYFPLGPQAYRVGKRVCDCVSGSLVLVPPQTHHCPAGGSFQRCELNWVQLLLDDASMPILCPDESAAVRQLLSAATRKQPLPAPAALPGLFQDLFELGCTPSPWQRSALRACLGRIVTVLCQGIREGENEVAPYSPAIREALAWIDAHYAEDVRLEQIARHVGLSRRQFHARFRKETGLPPNEYRLRKRLNAGTDLLAQQDLSVTEIAFRVGFSSSQYFATAFKRMFGCPPTRYRERHL